MKVLIPVEDALFASAIVGFISNHDWKPGTEFCIMNVIEPYLTDEAAPGVPHAPMASLFAATEKQILSQAQSLVDSVAARLRKVLPEARLESLVLKGHITDEILQRAKNEEIDLIVAGSHGRNGFQRFFLGSVSFILATEAPCSVVLVKPDEDILDDWTKIEHHHSADAEELLTRLEHKIRDQKNKRIMLALDESSNSDQIVDFVMHHSWAVAPHFQLITVLRRPEHGIFPVTEALTELYEDKVKIRRSTLRRLALKMRDHYHSPHIEESLLEGDPKETIVEAARLWGADLIVVGCHYRNALQRMAISSVSMAVLSTAPCSVLLLKEKQVSSSSRKEQIAELGAVQN